MKETSDILLQILEGKPLEKFNEVQMHYQVHEVFSRIKISSLLNIENVSAVRIKKPWSSKEMKLSTNEDMKETSDIFFTILEGNLEKCLKRRCIAK